MGKSCVHNAMYVAETNPEKVSCRVMRVHDVVIMICCTRAYTSYTINLVVMCRKTPMRVRLYDIKYNSIAIVVIIMYSYRKKLVVAAERLRNDRLNLIRAFNVVS